MLTLTHRKVLAPASQTDLTGRGKWEFAFTVNVLGHRLINAITVAHPF